MRFYLINKKDMTKTENIEVILDRNTTAKTDYATALTQVGTDTADWTVAAQYEGLNGRLITANEVARIVGYDTWDSSTATANNWFFFDSKTQTKVADSSNLSNYAWLFNNTKECSDNGCTVADSSTYGYWTSTLLLNYSTRAWIVRSDGMLHDYNDVSAANVYGVRPVITISKDAIK